MVKQSTKRVFSRLSVFTATVGGATVILGAASLASRALGLLRDRLLATGFGASADLDVYYAAFRIPDFIFQLLILGAISAAFIPVFAGYLANKQEKEANRVASSVLNIGLLVLTAGASLAWIFAPQLTPLVAPGFSEAQQAEVVNLTRIMLLSPIFFGISGILGSILNSHHRFLAYASAPLFYNFGLIAGALVAPKYGLEWLGIGVVAGAFLQMAVQLGAVLRTGFRYRPAFELSHPGVRKIGWLMLPATAGIAVLQINLMLETVIASTLREGSLSQFMLATSLSMLPVGVIGASFATAVFPILAKAASTKQTDVFSESLVRVIRQILYFIIPASIAMMLLRAQIVRLIYGAGKFDFTDTRFVTSLLGILAVSLFAQALIPLLTRAFYALRNTKTPVVIAAVCMVVNVGSALIASYYLGVVGLAIGFSFGSVVQLGLLFFFLSAKVPSIDDADMLQAVTRMVTASLVMGGVIYGSLYGVAYLAEQVATQYTVAYFALQTTVASALGAATYLFLTKRWGMEEADIFFRLISRKKKGKQVR